MVGHCRPEDRHPSCPSLRELLEGLSQVLPRDRETEILCKALRLRWLCPCVSQRKTDHPGLEDSGLGPVPFSLFMAV